MKRKTMSERQRLQLRERFNEVLREWRKAYPAEKTWLADQSCMFAAESMAWSILLAYASQPKSTPARRRVRMEIACAESMK